MLETLDYKYIDALTCTSLLQEELILIKDYEDEQGIILKKGTKVISLGRTANEKLEQIGYSTSDGRSRTYLPLAALGRKTPSPVCAIDYCTRSGPVYKCTGCNIFYHKESGAIKLDR